MTVVWIASLFSRTFSMPHLSIQTLICRSLPQCPNGMARGEGLWIRVIYLVSQVHHGLHLVKMVSAEGDIRITGVLNRLRNRSCWFQDRWDPIRRSSWWSQAPSSIGTGRFGGNFVKSSCPAATPEAANVAAAPSQDRRVIYLFIRPSDPLGECVSSPM